MMHVTRMRYMMAKNRKGIARACAVLVTKILVIIVVKRLKTERRIKKRSKCMGSGMHGFGNAWVREWLRDRSLHVHTTNS